jgi:hypothetical protein
VLGNIAYLIVDTVVISFLAKLKSDLDHFYERQDEEETYDYIKEDLI